jgi:large subunit ribosomal protein L19e
MQLAKKKELAAKVLKVGKDRVIFVREGLAQIKEAITRQDILDLKDPGIIKIREISGRKTVTKRKHRRGMGKVKKRVNKSKQKYVKLTRKLRGAAKGLLGKEEIDKEKYHKIRKMTKASKFKSKRHLHEMLNSGDL